MAEGGAKFSVLGVNISAVNLSLAEEKIDRWIQERQRVYICVAPVSTVVSGHDDPEYLRVLNQAAMVTPDGMPLVWLAHRQGLPQVGRTYGPDLMRLVCDRGRVKQYRHFFYGGTLAASAQLEEVLREQYEGIRIVGRISPPFRDLTPDEILDHIQAINGSHADILWVGLGSPKQDFWMAANRDKLNVPVLVGVGAAFDFVAGTKPQAPSWMRSHGLEWLFRLGCEPQRLARRYFIGNSRFVILLMKDWFKK